MGGGLTGLALVLLLLSGTGFPAYAQGGAGQVQAKRRELGRIQKELEQTKAELEESRRQEAALSREVHRLEGRGGETHRRISAIQRNIREAEAKRANLKNRIGALSLASGFWTTVLLSELRDHALGLAGREEAWGRRQLWAEAFRRAALLEKARMIANLRGYRLKTEAAVEAARRRAAGLQDKNRRAQAEERSVRQECERQQAAVAQARERVAAAEKKAKDLEETKLALAQLLSRIGRYEIRGVAAVLDVPKHSLPWPVDGVLARPFGRERNLELNTWAIHQGATFAARSGSAVGAVGPGRIIYAGPFRSYGLVVIVDHGNGFFSIYGELGKILKAKGSLVETGESLATAGGQGDKGGLYLELRRGSEALDPMVWLQKK